MIVCIPAPCPLTPTHEQQAEGKKAAAAADSKAAMAKHTEEQKAAEAKDQDGLVTGL
jgi:hypothetical protein